MNHEKSNRRGIHDRSGSHKQHHAILKSNDSFQKLLVRVLLDFACLLKEKSLQTVKMAIWRKRKVTRQV